MVRIIKNTSVDYAFTTHSRMAQRKIDTLRTIHHWRGMRITLRFSDGSHSAPPAATGCQLRLHR